MTHTNLFDFLYEKDLAAEFFYHNYRFVDGTELSKFHQTTYTINASLLNTIRLIEANPRLISKLLKNKKTGLWDVLTLQLKFTKDQIKHKLPSSKSRIKKVYGEYLTNGYPWLISEKFGNSNSRKVDDNVSKLLNAISEQIKSTNSTLIKKSLDSFIAGNLKVYKISSTEAFTCQDFEALKISRGTIDYNVSLKINKSSNLEVIKEEMKVSNQLFCELKKFNPERRVNLMKQFIGIIELIKK